MRPGGGADDADIIVLVIDAAKRLDDDTERILAAPRRISTLTRIAALNKVDRVEDKERLLALTAELDEAVDVRSPSS